MKEVTRDKRNSKVKDFFKGLVEKLDKKVEEKTKSPKCSCSDKSKNSSCCSK